MQGRAGLGWANVDLACLAATPTGTARPEALGGLHLEHQRVHASTAARLGERASSKTPPGEWRCRLCDFSACGRDEGGCPVANLSELAVERQLDGSKAAKTQTCN
jgi:hypothetical protein